MAQFEVYPQADQRGYWLDCQTDIMEHFETRFVVPLMPLDLAPVPARLLNPLFEIAGETHSMVTQFAGTIPAAELRNVAGSFESRRYEILNALDFLLTGV